MPQMPAAITAYFAFTRDGDARALSSCFTLDAVVHDEGRDHRGIDAITKWRDEAMAQTAFVAKPLSVEERAGRITVATEVTGNFPQSPIILDHVFTLEGDRISALEIHA